MFEPLIRQVHEHAPALKRGDKLVVPNGSARLEAGDVLTLIRGEGAVYAAREKLDGVTDRGRHLGVITHVC